MTITKSSLRRRVPLVAALAALALCLWAPQALARYVYTGNYTDDSVSVIDTATNQIVGTPIPAGDGPYTMAVTPNGKALYVGNQGSEDLTVIDTQTNQAVGSIPLGTSPATIAISPDGKTAYVTSDVDDIVVVVDLQTALVVGAPIPVGEGPWGIAISPDGKTAYITNEEEGTVSVIDTATRQAVGTIPVGEGPINATISPDGKTVYVANEDEDTVSVIDTATQQVVGVPIPTGDNPWSLALAPNGAKLYVSNYNDGTVSVIETATRQVVGAPIPTNDEPYELAVTPDGNALYVVNYEEGGTEDGSVTVINTQTDQVTTTVPVAGGPWQLAIVPNQSPTASFAAGTTFSRPVEALFVGNHSSDPDGTVTRFDWSFGDGFTSPNGGPVATHKYAVSGTYTATLTVTDNEGCSVGMVFTGRTAYCSGSPLATQQNSVNFTRESLVFKTPNNFKFGKLKRNVRKGTAKLTISVPAAGRIVVSGRKVKRSQRSAKKAGKVTLNIRPKPKTKKQLVRKGSAKVQVKVTFRPLGGAKRTKSKSVKLIQR